MKCNIERRGEYGQIVESSFWWTHYLKIRILIPSSFWHEFGDPRRTRLWVPVQGF